MTPADLEQRARKAARLAIGREPTPGEVCRVLACWLAELDGAVSAGFLRRAPLRPVRPPKPRPPAVDEVLGGGDA